MKKKYQFLLPIKILATAISAVLAYHFFLQGKYFVVAFFVILCVALLLSPIFNESKKRSETEHILAAISNKDFEIFPQKISDDPVKNEAVGLYYKMKADNEKLTSYKLLYEDILNRLETGFLILQQRQKAAPWNVFFSNEAVLHLLEIPNYQKWDFYREKVPPFFDLIEKTNYEDSHQIVDFTSPKGFTESYSVRTTRVEFPNETFFVISFESVQSIIERKEKNAWNNLMKVISHELLNTLTPVNSLVQNLEYISEQDEISAEERQDMRESLKVISGKSQQLVQFINNYRQVAELPKPVKSDTDLKQMIENSVQFYREEFEKNGISLELNLQNLRANVDERMLGRVLVNLLNNAIAAVEDSENKEISVSLFREENRTIIAVRDTGTGIPDSVRDKIFLPFFTTRKVGSGIGLTLSKSIMEAHHGYLIYKSQKPGSVFEMWLP